MVKRWVAAALVIAAGSMASAGPVNAQFISATFGQSLYSVAPGCPTPGSFLTTYRLSGQTSIIGLSASFNNGDYPWPPMDGGLAPAAPEALTHGDALSLAAEVYPFGLLQSEGGRRLASFVRPFVGIGLQRTSDGDPVAATGSAPQADGVVGGTDLFLTYGAALSVPTTGGLRLVVELRGNSVFAGDYEAVPPGGAPATFDGATLTWGELSVGFSYRVR